MAAEKMSLWSRKGLLVWLTGFTIAYQIIYQAFIMHALQQENELAECNVESSSGVPRSLQSPYCAELQLFKSWQQVAPVHVGDTQGVEHLLTDEDVLIAPLGNSFEVALARLSNLSELSTTPSIDSTTTSHPSIGSNLSRELLDRSQQLKAAFEAIADDRDAWERKFEAKALRVRKEMCSEPLHRKRADCIGFLAEPRSSSEGHDKGVATMESRLAVALNSTSWSLAFMQEVRKTQKDMCNEPGRRTRTDCVHILAAIAEVEHQEESARQAVRRYMTSELLDKAAEIQLHGKTGQNLEIDQHIRQVHKEMCSGPERRSQRECVEFLVLAESSPSRARMSDLASNDTTWSQAFLQEVRRTQKEMCNEVHRRNRTDCIKLMAEVAESERQEKAAKRVARRLNVRQELRKKSEELDDNLKKIADENRAWERKFQEKVRRAHQDLCDQPHHRHRKECVGYASAEDEYSASLLTTDLMTEIRNAQREMCQEAHRRHRLDCITLMKEISISEQQQVKTANQTSPQEKQTRKRAFLEKRSMQLQWTSVRAQGRLSRFIGDLGKRSRATAHASDLQKHRWVGRIPSVACIAAVPFGSASRFKIREWITRFHLQNYEGSTSLVFVYHYADDETARLMGLYADGVHIKAVAAHGEIGLPSTTSLRFGAWSVENDVDVIAHWDLATHYSHDRLSSQVRALAHASRPACVWQTGNKSDNEELTLVGEAKWMHLNWYPFLGKPFLHGVDDKLVEVSPD
eukprot:TRINITY_DN37836_c0_g1_i1.p1 TRINITY_DN37836_c0_g1~~TRINITY_DN37836_c0_g1_i1.p1  ORF type:complete len:745 (-),score=90.66 TRINITY_DN37836_c0_g1_i1:81-2315(-)